MLLLELSMMIIQVMLVKLSDQSQLLAQSGGRREQSMVKKLKLLRYLVAMVPIELTSDLEMLVTQ